MSQGFKYPAAARKRLELLRDLGWGPVSIDEYFWLLRRLSRQCTAEDIADFLQVNRQMVLRDFRLAGIKPRPSRRPAKRYAGVPLKKLAADIGVSVTALYHRVYRYNSIKLRGKWRGRKYKGRTIREWVELAGVSYHVAYRWIKENGEDPVCLCRDNR